MAILDSGYYLNSKHLEELATKYQSIYKQAKPFPHIVIDNFLATEVLDQILDEFSATDSLNNSTLDGTTGSKYDSNLAAYTGRATQRLLDQLSSATFINFLEKLTSVDKLLPNPQVESSGLSSLEQGNQFKIQVDVDRWVSQLDRKLTILIYFNKDWKEEYGGHLELWDAEMSHCEKKILPTFNRCVIFSTTSFSYHGHPEPLNCPDHETRKLLSLYYYSDQHHVEAKPSLRTIPFTPTPERSGKWGNNRLKF